jgi:16S rRNA (cytosine1402-N4)-methyltransferase
MQVNQEIAQIEGLLEAVPTLVKPGARVVALCFHSIEDKLVARTFRDWEGQIVSASWPGAQDRERLGKHITRKAVLPGETELAENPRARSARLRAFEFTA